MGRERWKHPDYCTQEKKKRRLCLLLAINVIQGHLYCIWEKYRFRVHVNSFVSVMDKADYRLLPPLQKGI